MVGYYQAYKGSTQTPLIYHGDKLVKKVYHGSNLVYQIGFASITYTQNGTFTVPAGITKIHVDCVAGAGYNYGGKGGRVQCDLSVSAGDVLNIVVGAIPSSIATATYNASDIRKGGNQLNDRIIIAGGGGNGKGESIYNTQGGDGGGLIGGNAGTPGLQSPATGGTQTEGGTRSSASGGSVYEAYWGTNGTFGLGGNGGTRGGSPVGGAGGAGYFGGGGGSAFVYSGAGSTASGGGGGSSYTNEDCSNVIHTQGFNSGAGYITISMVE